MKRTPTDIPKASKEVVLEAAKLSNPAARFLVANYLDAQEARKRGDMQIRHLGEKRMTELARTLEWTAGVHAKMEDRVKALLKKYAEGTPVGRWCLAQYGVGPVLAAGFQAHIDLEWSACTACGKKEKVAHRCDCGAPFEIVTLATAGQLWRFCGLDPSRKWQKGQRRPWNAAMKQLVFHFGNSMVKFHDRPDCFYGQIYGGRKALLVARNEAGYYAERAKTFVTNSAEVKKLLATGKLPASNLDKQAKDYAAKIFLSHLHAIMYWDHFGKPPEKPFSISILGHAHEIRAPHAEMFPGFAEAYYGGMQQAAE